MTVSARARLLTIYLAIALCPGLAAHDPAPASPGGAGCSASDASAPDAKAVADVARLIQVGSYAQAEALAREVLREIEEAHGQDSLQAAQPLDLLSEAMRRGGKAGDPQTLALAERAVAIKEKALGRDHPEVAVSLHNLGSALYVSGQYASARPILERALEIRQKALGPDDPRVARSMDYLGNLLSDMGDDAAAEPLLYRGLHIREKSLPADHPDIAESLNAVAKFLFKRGDYDGAKPYYESALRIREKELGPDHPAVAISLNNLASLLLAQADDSGARPLYERALAIRQRALGPEHPLVATSLHNLGYLIQGTGDPAAARPLFDRALEIRTMVFGADHPTVAVSLSRLADLLLDIGDDATARTLHQRALGIRETAYGPDHPTVASSLLSLGRVHLRMGDTIAARALYERGLAIQEKALGPDHPEVAYSLGLLANVNLLTGNHEIARPLYQRCLEIREKALGPAHPWVAWSLSDLALLLAEIGQVEPALSATLRAEEIGRQHLRLTGRMMAERQALRYASMRATGLDLALSLAAGDPRGIPDLRRRVWDALVRSRALVLDEMAVRRRAIGEAEDAVISRLAGAVRSASTRLANLVVRGPGDDPPERYRGQLDQVRAENELAERALAQRSGAFGRQQAQGLVGLTEVWESLPASSALVAFSVFVEHRRAPGRIDSPGADLARLQEPRHEADRAGLRYLAFILRSDREEPAAVALGPAVELEDLVLRWREEAARGLVGPGNSSRQAEDAYRVAGEALRRKVWDPLEPHLRGSKLVFIVPEGALSLVSLAALPAGQGGYLIEAGPLLHYLSAERELVSLRARGAPGEGMLALGDPSFDVSPQRAGGPTAPQSQRMPSAPIDVSASVRGSRSSCGRFDAIRFEPLPASARELAELVSLWRQGAEGEAIPLGGEQATEAAFKRRAPGKRTLHLATHGFFLGADCVAGDAAPARGIGAMAPDERQRPPAVLGENPLHLSGLALAGANRRGSAGPEEEDGILTAEEISALDLSGVEWAVLSACDTGVGKVMLGEGVLGLRRAFAVAGAGTVIMSLWPVEDEATRRWMRALYEARLMKGLGTAAAVRQASLEMLGRGAAGGGGLHPFYWAGFVAAGDWR